MARTGRARPRRVWLWRWRRNPLRRRSDVVEAWIVLATWIAALLVGLLAGQAAAAVTQDTLDARRAAAHPVSAVLTENADRTPALTGDGTGGTVQARVRWTAPDGTVRTGLARVVPGRSADTSVKVWIDHGGNLVREPPGAEEARLQSALTGVLVALVAGSVPYGCGCLARLRLERRRLRDWETEWARVAPSGGRT
ncbi:hypothetical protein ACH3Y9_33580 [Streptomyces sp. WSLK1-5]|uniref:Rv1733c family protein n=1 Tax=unclassified Streptomyces TaxID=2593676 RepID=UPI003794EA47